MPKVARMMTSVRLLTRVCASACAMGLVLTDGGAQARAHRHAHGAGQPVVVELYTAQGCSNCVKANGVIGDLGADKSVIPLTFSVDLWDYLGWADTLAQPEFTARQRAYAQRLKVREIYTPEIVVQGEAEGLATDRAKTDALIAKAESAPRHGPHIRFLRHDARVRISGPGEGGDVWLIRYDPAPQTVKVKSGETKGQTVTVRNGVRSLKKLGVWRGSLKTYVLPKADDANLKTVILVQTPRGGRILAAARG
jgi:hypothetical protein